jgi:glutathione synthase
MIVQPAEKNLFDQRHIENSLFKTHGIKLLRYTLLQISKEAVLLGPERRLMM